MDALAQFTIPVSGLHDGQHEYDFSIDKSFFQCFPESPIKDGQVAVRFTFDKHPDMYIMTFDLEGVVNIECDRCLEMFDLPIEDEQELLFKFDEKEWEDADIVYILKDTPQLNIASYIYDFINLAVPISKSHEDAELECDPEMMKFLTKESEEPTIPPTLWDALKGLHTDN